MKPEPFTDVFRADDCDARGAKRSSTFISNPAVSLAGSQNKGTPTSLLSSTSTRVFAPTANRSSSTSSNAASLSLSSNVASFSIHHHR